MNEEAKKESCCNENKHCCCKCKKLIVSILLGLLLFGFGYCLGKKGYCPMNVCPLSQQK